MKRRAPAPAEVVKPGPSAYHKDLRVDPGLFRARFAAGCDTRLCAAVCCEAGVWLDPGERDRVLEHADLVRQAMDPDQPRDTRRWFSRRSHADADFPSGRAVYTRVHNGRCVFLNGAGRCVLQKASSTVPGGPQLKPFFCTSFPVTIDRGALTLEHRARQPCCAPTPAGPLTVFDICRVELRHVLGAAGVRSLRRLAARRGRRARPQR